MIENVFSIKILNRFSENTNDIKSQLFQSLNNIKFNYNSNWGKTHLLSTKTFSEDQLSQHNLNLLQSFIDESLKEYCKSYNIDYKPYDMTSWIALYKSGDYAHLHNHGEADISGVYYIQTHENSGDIFFSSPSPGAEASSIYKEHKEHYSYKPKDGLLLMFPGFLNHGTHRNENENDRISISFNINFK